MKINDEIVDAKNTLAESQGQQIADEHEDSAKQYDPTDLEMASERTSYKQEKKERQSKTYNKARPQPYLCSLPYLTRQSPKQKMK